MILPFLSTTEQDTIAFGKSLAERVALRPEWGKMIFLSGELGTGKTTLARAFFEQLGVQNTVKSPTFTYFQEYMLPQGTVVHGDFYRLGENSEATSMLLEQLEEYRKNDPVFLGEWADLLPEEVREALSRKRIEIDIQHGKTSKERLLHVHFADEGNVPEEEVLRMMDEFFTPIHVRRHILAVTEVASTLAVKLFEKGIFLNPELVKSGALSHDLVRYVDFSDFDNLGHYEEEIIAEKLQYWKMLHRKYHEKNHGEAIAEILRGRGFTSTASVAATHMTLEIFREEPFSWEEKIVYYADKRVLHDTIVTLEKRFADGRKRYGHEANPELEQKVFALEKEIFMHLDIEPEEMGGGSSR